MWATNLVGNYGNNENGDLISPVIDLTGYTGKKTGVDLVAVAVTTPTTVNPCRRERGLRKDVDDRVWAYRGQLESRWAEKLIVLSEAYAVAGFRVRFRFESGTWGTAPGWYIDDVGVTTLRKPDGGLRRAVRRLAAEGMPPVARTVPGRGVAPTTGPGSAHSGTKAWATNLAGNYNNSEDSAVTSPAIDLTAYGGQWLVVSWWQWLQTEGGNDRRSLEVTADGTTWTPRVWAGRAATSISPGRRSRSR